MTRVEVFLERMLKNGTHGNALLFCRCNETVADRFARRILRTEKNGEHPDLFHFRPSGKTAMHPIDSVRAFLHEVNFPPTQSKRRVFIFHDVERMLPVSANALLKTLEEPISTSVCLLLTNAPQKVLPTILSRCRKVYFPSEMPAVNLGEHPISACLVEVLKSGRCVAYGELQERMERIINSYEALRKEFEVEIEVEDGVELSAYLKDKLSREGEGVASLRMRLEWDHFFETLLSWFRDLEAVKLGADKWVIHPEAAVQRSWIKLEKVFEIVEEAKKGLERSTPFKTILEVLFLKLGYL